MGSIRRAFQWSSHEDPFLNPSATCTITPKAEFRDPQIQNLYHGELTIPPGELTMKSAETMLGSPTLTHAKRGLTRIPLDWFVGWGAEFVTSPLQTSGAETPNPPNCSKDMCTQIDSHSFMSGRGPPLPKGNRLLPILSRECGKDPYKPSYAYPLELQALGKFSSFTDILPMLPKKLRKVLCF